MGDEDDVTGGKDQAEAQAQAPSRARAQRAFQIDIKYEFSAPHYFDFVQGETSEEAHKAECWFKTACTNAASPFVPKINPRRSFAFEALCSFEEAEQAQQLVARLPPEYSKENGCTVDSCTAKSCSTEMSKVSSTESRDNAHQDINQEMEVHAPSAQVMPYTVNKATCLSRKPSVAKSAGNKLSKQPSSGGNCTREVKNTRQAINRSILLKKENCAEKSAAEENQAVKRQKLEAGRLRKILTIDEHILPHKRHPNMAANKDSTVSIYKNNERKWNSAYECRTSEQLHQQSLTHHDGTGAPSEKNKALILTIPKDPGLQNAQRSEPTRFKSADELEEEMCSKIPKFKARPLNQKILEAPLLPPLQKTVPQLSEFQEFHLKRLERSLQHSCTSSSTDSAVIPDKRPCKSVTGVVLKPWNLLLRACPPK